MLYPGCIKKEYKRNISHKNRGMKLENLINQTNEYYIENDIAIIYKKPPPILVCQVDYKKNKILEGYYKTPSTLDYNGIYKGKYIDFDAKETKNKTSFPLANIHPHQIKHIERVINHWGISFILLKMNDNYYYLKGEDLLDFIKNNNRKSIPFEFIDSTCKKIKENYNPALDYLKIIDKLYLGGSHEKKYLLNWNKKKNNY